MAEEARDWKLDVNGVPMVAGGDLVLVYGREGIAQNIRTALELAKEEWFLNLDEGIPLFEEILVKNPRLEIIRAAIRRTILSVRGVASVELTLVFDPKARTLTVDFTAQTSDGPVVDVVTLERNP